MPVLADDVFVDLGSGRGKVVFVAHLFTGARCRGIEREGSLVRDAARARGRLEREGPMDVSFVHSDARDAAIDDGTVFFLYVPFTGAVLKAVLDRLFVVARARAIVVCTLGFDLERDAPWLSRRPLDAFWLAIYDSVVPGVPRRPVPPGSLDDAVVRAIVHEQRLE